MVKKYTILLLTVVLQSVYQKRLIFFIMKPSRQAYILALSAILFWSTIASALKIGLKYAETEVLLFWASLTSIIFFIIYNTVRGNLKKIFNQPIKKYFTSALLGFLNPFLYYLILFKAYNLLNAQEAGTLNYIWPLFLVLLSIVILKHKVHYLSIIAIAISFFGLIIISTQGKVSSLSFTNPTGVALAVGSAFIWALYWIFNMKDPRDIAIKLNLNFIFGLLYIIIYLLYHRTQISLPIQGYIASIYIGLFECGITFLIWLTALQKARNASVISHLVYISPFISLILIQIILKEKILPATIIGLVFIITGIILQEFINKRKKHIR